MCPDGMRWKVRVGGAVFFRAVTGVLPQRRGSLRAGQRPAGGSSAVQEEHAEPSGLCVPPPCPATIPALSAAPQARASHRMASDGVRLCAAACGVCGVPAAKNSSQQERPGRASLRCPRPRSPRALLVSCRLCPGPGSVPARPSTRALGCRASSRRTAVIRSERVQALTSPAPRGPHWLPPLSPAVPHGVAPSVPFHGLTAHFLLASSMWAEPGPLLCGNCFARHGRPPGRRGGGLCSDPWLLSSPAACSRPVPSASSAPLLWSDCWTTVGFKSGSLFFPYLHTLLRDHIHFHGFKYRLHNNDF